MRRFLKSRGVVVSSAIGPLMLANGVQPAPPGLLSFISRVATRGIDAAPSASFVVLAKAFISRLARAQVKRVALGVLALIGAASQIPGLFRDRPTATNSVHVGGNYQRCPVENDDKGGRGRVGSFVSGEACGRCHTAFTKSHRTPRLVGQERVRAMEDIGALLAEDSGALGLENVRRQRRETEWATYSGS
jgi:hypothetical protein